MLAPPLYSVVSAVISLGFTARETIPIVFFGFLTVIYPPHIHQTMLIDAYNF
jgi:hypothetical protein